LLDLVKHKVRITNSETSEPWCTMPRPWEHSHIRTYTPWPVSFDIWPWKPIQRHPLKW